MLPYLSGSLAILNYDFVQVFGRFSAKLGPQTPKYGGRSPPTFWHGFWGPRGRPDPENRRFPVGPKQQKTEISRARTPRAQTHIAEINARDSVLEVDHPVVRGAPGRAKPSAVGPDTYLRLE